MKNDVHGEERTNLPNPVYKDTTSKRSVVLGEDKKVSVTIAGSSSKVSWEDLQWRKVPSRKSKQQTENGAPFQQVYDQNNGNITKGTNKCGNITDDTEVSKENGGTNVEERSSLPQSDHLAMVIYYDAKESYIDAELKTNNSNDQIVSKEGNSKISKVSTTHAVEEDNLDYVEIACSILTPNS